MALTDLLMQSRVYWVLYALTVAEAVAFWYFVFKQANYNHFTWWGITIYSVFLLSWLVGLQKYTWVYTATVEFVILVGVWAMSVLECETMVQASNDNSAPVFIFGNFAIHYWPFFGTIARRSVPPQSFIGQCIMSLMTFFLYCALQRPSSVYGCEVTHTLIAFGAQILIFLWMCVIVKHPGFSIHWADKNN